MERYYDDNLTPVRCICGNIPTMAKANDHSPVTFIICEHFTCNIVGIIGTNRFTAVRTWNDMIRKIMEDNKHE